MVEKWRGGCVVSRRRHNSVSKNEGVDGCGGRGGLFGLFECVWNLVECVKFKTNFFPFEI